MGLAILPGVGYAPGAGAVAAGPAVPARLSWIGAAASADTAFGLDATALPGPIVRDQGDDATGHACVCARQAEHRHRSRVAGGHRRQYRQGRGNGGALAGGAASDGGGTWDPDGRTAPTAGIGSCFVAGRTEF